MEEQLAHEQKHRDRHDGENRHIAERVIDMLADGRLDPGIEIAEPAEDEEGGDRVDRDEGNADRQAGEHQEQDRAEQRQKDPVPLHLAGFRQAAPGFLEFHPVAADAGFAAVHGVPAEDEADELDRHEQEADRIGDGNRP